MEKNKHKHNKQQKVHGSAVIRGISLLAAVTALIITALSPTQSTPFHHATPATPELALRNFEPRITSQFFIFTFSIHRPQAADDTIPFVDAVLAEGIANMLCCQIKPQSWRSQVPFTKLFSVCASVHICRHLGLPVRVINVIPSYM